jgi:hypothetical protein
MKNQHQQHFSTYTAPQPSTHFPTAMIGTKHILPRPEDPMHASQIALAALKRSQQQQQQLIQQHSQKNGMQGFYSRPGSEASASSTSMSLSFSNSSMSNIDILRRDTSNSAIKPPQISPLDALSQSSLLDGGACVSGMTLPFTPQYTGCRYDVAKPPYSYASLIAQALLATPDRKLTLSQIYAWIMEKYPYYQSENSGWQNSIRHNLSLNSCCVKLAKADRDQMSRLGSIGGGKGAYWTINEAELGLLNNGTFKRRKLTGVDGIGKSRRKRRAAAAAAAAAAASVSAAPNMEYTHNKGPDFYTSGANTSANTGYIGQAAYMGGFYAGPGLNTMPASQMRGASMEQPRAVDFGPVAQSISDAWDGEDLDHSSNALEKSPSIPVADLCYGAFRPEDAPRTGAFFDPQSLMSGSVAGSVPTDSAAIYHQIFNSSNQRTVNQNSEACAYRRPADQLPCDPIMQFINEGQGSLGAMLSPERLHSSPSLRQSLPPSGASAVFGKHHGLYPMSPSCNGTIYNILGGHPPSLGAVPWEMQRSAAEIQTDMTDPLEYPS